jgi:phospholipid/cholesterol/gamma-HCH transport system substrate-binding protein
MNGRVNYILLGVFVLLLSVAMIAVVLWLGSGGPRKDYDRYLVYMTESVSGLSKDAAVKYRGVEVGRVRKISLDPDNLERVQLVLEIQRGTAIKEDTHATLETQGLTGLANINLVGGSQQSPWLAVREGDEYPVIKSEPSLLGRLDKGFSKLIADLTESSRRFNAMFSDENQRAATNTIRDLEQLSSSLASRKEDLVALLDKLSVIADDTQKASSQLPALAEQVAHAIAALDSTASQFETIGHAVEEVINEGGEDVLRFTGDTLSETSVMMEELRQTAQNLRRISEQLERDPSIMLYGAPSPVPGPGETGVAAGR